MLCCWRRRRADFYDDDEHYHVHRRRRDRRHATVTAFCLITASVLFLFVALSLPIIKSVYLLQLEGHPSSSQPATSLGTQLRFGVWGFCVTRSAHTRPPSRFFFFFCFFTPARFSEPTQCDIPPNSSSERASKRNSDIPYHTLFFSPSALNKPTFFKNNGECVGPQLGYTIDPTFIAGVTNEPDLASLILKALTILLVLHPIAAGLAFLTVLPIAASCCVFHRAPWIISLVLSIATAIMSTIVFAADLALVLVARHKLREQNTFNVTVDFGNGIWIVLVSMLFTWVALFLLSARVCGCCRFGRYYFFPPPLPHRVTHLRPFYLYKERRRF